MTEHEKYICISLDEYHSLIETINMQSRTIKTLASVVAEKNDCDA